MELMFKSQRNKNNSAFLHFYGTSCSKCHFGKGYFTIVKPHPNFTTIQFISGSVSDFLAQGSMALW